MKLKLKSSKIHFQRKTYTIQSATNTTMKYHKYNDEVPQIQSVPDQFRQRFSSPANNHLSPFRVSEGHRWTNPDEDDLTKPMRCMPPFKNVVANSPVRVSCLKIL